MILTIVEISCIFVPKWHIGVYFRVRVPLYEAERGSLSCLQSASHCHSDLRTGRQCVALCTPASRRHLSAMRREQQWRAKSEFYLHQTIAAKPMCDVNLKVFPCAYLPQRGVELMDDHFHLLTASKGHDGVIAGKRSMLREVGHCVKQKNNHYQAMM